MTDGMSEERANEGLHDSYESMSDIESIMADAHMVEHHLKCAITLASRPEDVERRIEHALWKLEKVQEALGKMER